MDEHQATKFLAGLESQILLRHRKALNQQQKNHLFQQLKTIDFKTLQKQQQLLNQSLTKNRSITPFINYSLSGNHTDRELGKKLISEGLVGCLIVAGGQGSRLKIEGPKGVCQVTKIRKKSLFQLFAEKTIAASKQANRLLPLAIMTSPFNHQETVAFFEKNNLFKLDPKQISFFQQETLPLLDQEGNLFLESLDTLSKGPDGNGGALHQFFKSRIWEEWYSIGVRYVNFVLIDNPLADPFDAELIGYQKRLNSDIVIKSAKRENSEENVGLIVKENGKAAIIEYSELSQEDRFALNSDGSFRHSLANLSLFSFKMDFIKEIATTSHPVLHKAFKAVKFLDDQGNTLQAQNPMAWKFEKFIFDFLPLATKVDVLVYPKDVCFAPLKNFTGNHSFETVATALEYSDQQTLSSITNSDCHLSPLEISQEFYYPTLPLLKKWEKKSLMHSGYIES